MVHRCQQESELAVDWLNLGQKGETFWDRLQEAFNQANAPAIAHTLKVEKQAVYKWRGGKMPSLENLIAISESTGRSLHWLITGEGSPYVESREGAAVKAKEKTLSPEDRKQVESLISALQLSLEEK